MFKNEVLTKLCLYITKLVFYNLIEIGFLSVTSQSWLELSLLIGTLSIYYKKVKNLLVWKHTYFAKIGAPWSSGLIRQ